MTSTDAVYLVVLSGDPERAHSFAEKVYPTNPKVVIEKRRFTEGSWSAQLCAFRRLRGEALILFTESLETMWEPQLKLFSALLHRCRLTIFADEALEYRTYARRDVIRQIPRFAWSGVLDMLTFASAGPARRLLAASTTSDSPRRSTGRVDLDLLYLYPFPFQPLHPGGELSYLRGTLRGFAEISLDSEVVSGCRVPVGDFRVHVVPNERRHYLFKESQELSYNLRFVLGVQRTLARRRLRVLYQRHGRFVLAGAILARLLHVPLALEYQASEYWLAKTWGAARFVRLIKRIEDVALAAASIIVVVSEALRRELIAQGVPSEKIIVNPAAVDPRRFQSSQPRRDRMRADLEILDGDVLVAFVGSFSHWHGIDVLERAILRLVDGRDGSPKTPHLRFLLVGDGPLKRDMERRLREGGAAELTTFTGSVVADRIPDLLDAADILIAPNVQMPGTAFFGSPSKLFEYMAMGKAIVASDLDQLAEVLTHQHTAWLFPPEDDSGLAGAVEHLARTPDLRSRLGRNARTAVLERYTWRHNALRLRDALDRLEQDLCMSSDSPPLHHQKPQTPHQSAGDDRPQCHNVLPQIFRSPPL
jgi:glycosyltransferase involved in cell wall biosynthesis